MKHLSLFILALAMAACAAPDGDPARQAEAAFGQYVAAVNSGESGAVAAMYDDNSGFHWVERGAVQYSSGEEAAASFEEMTASGYTVHMTADTVKVAVLSEDSALVSAHFDFAMTNEQTGAPFEFDGWMTVGMVKRGDGWKIAGGQTGPGVQVETQAD